MRAGTLNLLAGSSLALLASAAGAQTQPAVGAAAASAEPSFGLEEIIVTTAATIRGASFQVESSATPPLRTITM